MTICGHRPRGTGSPSAILRVSPFACASRPPLQHSKFSIPNSAPAAAHLQYGYDRASQRTWRRDLLATTYGQKQKPRAERSETDCRKQPEGTDRRGGSTLVGVLDRSKATWGAAPKARGAGLSQLLQSAKGILNLNQTQIGGIPDHQENWLFDQLGNWLNHKTQEDGNLLADQTRTHNQLNEIVTIDGTSEDIAYDANGNMTKVPDPTDGHRLLTWDGCSCPRSAHATRSAVSSSGNGLIGKPAHGAGRRCLAVRKADGTLIQTNRYDALTRRITSNPSATESLSVERHYYYNDQWRPIKETTGASPTRTNSIAWPIPPSANLNGSIQTSSPSPRTPGSPSSSTPSSPTPKPATKTTATASTSPPSADGSRPIRLG